MYAPTDIVLVFLILTDMVLLGSSRLGLYIRVSGIQGFILGVLPFLSHGYSLDQRVVMLAILGLGTILLKGVIFPRLLFRALREARVSREVQPYVGYTASTLGGVAALAVSIHLGGRLPLPGPAFSPLAVPAGLFTFLVGLFLIISRKKALTQVLGYLVLENGIFVLGIALVAEVSILVELGVLLDAFVAVFVMQIAIYQISQEFDSTDVDRMTALRG